jgi:SAM-dependent methyltransferase
MDMTAIAPGLHKAEDGIWYASGEQSISYPGQGNDNCFAVESTSWWFKHRNQCIVSVVNSFPPPRDGCIFDIGGGNGFVASGLAQAGYEVALVEPGQTGAENAKARGIKNVVCATTDTAKFEAGSLPAVGLFDVIEHIEDDKAFLEHMHALLKPSGMLYATVPAYSSLWSDEDVLAGHYRRYSLPQITERLTDAGFEVVFSSYFFRLLPLPIFLLRALPYKLRSARNVPATHSAERDHSSGGKWATGIVNMALRPELHNLARKTPMRFGASCLLAARPRTFA